MSALAVILPAAGASRRFGGARSKLLEPLSGVPVLARSAQAFLSRADVQYLIIPTDPQRNLLDDNDPAMAAIVSDRRVIICDGGDTRAHSVWAALRQVPANVEWVAVHDAARPLVSPTLIDRTLRAAQQHGAAVPALPVALTIKQAQGPLPARVQQTIRRDQLWAMQTPQIMRRAALLEAFERCPIPLEQVTDDVQLIELAGGEVWLVEGEERNLKITTPIDVRVAEMYLRG